MEQESLQSHETSIIQVLPYEVLEKICTYVPEDDRKSLALVCKIFYELVCEIERFELPLLLDGYTSINENFVNGMLFSKRKINRIVIQTLMRKKAYKRQELTIISRVLQKYSDIKILNVQVMGYYQWFTSSLYDGNNLRKLLKLLPNLEIIDIELVNLKNSFFQALTSLPKLKQVVVKFYCYKRSWNSTIENALKELIPRLQYYQFTFRQPSQTIRAALNNKFDAKLDYDRIILLEGP